MSTDPDSVLDLDKLSEGTWSETLEEFRSKPASVCSLSCSPYSIRKLKDFLCRLRAEGVPALVFLRAPTEILDASKILDVFETLRDWDQLLLKNVLELCSNWIPKEYHEMLKQEAKTELKWFEQWQAASHDARIHRYPALPWRSFLRKINTENYQFISDLFELSLRNPSAETKKLISEHIRVFLEAKKKTICIFPKRWN